MVITKLLEENEKLVSSFGAVRASELNEVPTFYTFQNDLVFSHRDFDVFFSALRKGKKCAIVSGFNASGSIHLGHKAVFDTNLFFQREFNVPVFIPISDDESYVSGKVKTQEEALANARKLARELLAYGFDPLKTVIIIDQIYTNIYNLAIKLSKKVTLSEIKATYGYTMENNPGLFFYPCIQAAHVLYPLEKCGFDHVLVPIGPDEDSHLRICRDIAARFGYPKPSVLHLSFLPGTDGQKMSKSKNNVINFSDDPPTIQKKVNKSYSGGQKTVEEHKRLGGNPESDIAFFYLQKFFLTKEESEHISKKYRSGEILSNELKKRLTEKLTEITSEFQQKISEINEDKLRKSIKLNES